MKPVSIVSVLVGAAMLGGCVGSIESVGAPGENGMAGGSGGTAARRAEDPLGALPPTPLRRLTRTEYNLTMRHLLGDTTNPGNALPGDTASKVFDNAAAGLTIDEVAFEAYERVAESVIGRATRAGSSARTKIFPCSPTTGNTACARRIVENFARKAWRRPVSAEEIGALMTSLDDEAKLGGTTEEGVKLALRSILVSPNFLYRVELDPGNPKGEHKVSPHELAARLSYFIYSSTPDDELDAHADDGTLTQPAVLTAQIARMLADPKAEALMTNFAAQWLGTAGVLRSEVGPDPKSYPSLDDNLRQAMKMESEQFFGAFLNGDRDVADMLDADFTFANARLARHYGVVGPTGATPQRVSLANSPRRGLLSQGSMLTWTSGRGRSSYTRRGNFILTRLLCTEVGLPPKMDLTPDPALPANPTPRQIAASHLKSDACKGCHLLMDPLGFGLEHFDAIGIWRDSYAGGKPIDTTGQLPGGTGFNGANELASAIKQDPRFTRCLAQQLYTFALGRDPTREDIDQAFIDRFTDAYRAKGGHLGDLITDLTQSSVFVSRGPAQ